MEANETTKARAQVTFAKLVHLIKVQGVSADKAWDIVFGEGAYQSLAGELYDALRAKAEQA